MQGIVMKAITIMRIVTQVVSLLHVPLFLSPKSSLSKVQSKPVEGVQTTCPVSPHLQSPVFGSFPSVFWQGGP